MTDFTVTLKPDFKLTVIVKDPAETKATLVHEAYIGSIEFKYISKLDEQTFKEWLKLTDIDIHHDDATSMRVTFNVRCVGSDSAVLHRESHTKLLLERDTIKKRYNDLLYDISDLRVYCLDDVGQGDFTCKGEAVKEDIDDILKEYESIE